MKHSILLLIASLFFITGCDKDSIDEDTFATWNVEMQSFQTDNRTFNNNEVISIADGTNNKLYIKFGSTPSAAATLKVVDYFKSPLAADEVTIGIAQGTFHYLSTGTDLKTLDFSATGELFTANFGAVQVKKYDAANAVLSTTSASGKVVFSK